MLQKANESAEVAETVIDRAYLEKKEEKRCFTIAKTS